MDWLPHLSLYLLGISSLLPLINPVGTALILDPFFKGQSVERRQSQSLSIVTYCFVLGLGVLLLGSWCLKFMGISIYATQLAGGILISIMGIELLNSKTDSSKGPESHGDISSSLFYPMSFPLTLGPGSISVLITLSAHAHADTLEQTWWHLAVLALSLFTVCALTYLCYAYFYLVVRRIGPSGSLIINRLSAFLVFCIGVQMTTTGITRIFNLHV